LDTRLLFEVGITFVNGGDGKGEEKCDRRIFENWAGLGGRLDNRRLRKLARDFINNRELYQPSIKTESILKLWVSIPDIGSKITVVGLIPE
jgi:hypothetical protein